MQEPLDLTPELERKKRQEDLELMRKHDRNQFFPVKQYEIKDTLAELNLRFMQYRTQSAYSDDFKILQTLQDFNRYVSVLQTFGKKRLTIAERITKAKVNYQEPVAMLNSKPVFVDASNPMVFTMEKPK